MCAECGVPLCVHHYGRPVRHISILAAEDEEWIGELEELASAAGGENEAPPKLMSLLRLLRELCHGH